MIVYSLDVKKESCLRLLLGERPSLKLPFHASEVEYKLDEGCFVFLVCNLLNVFVFFLVHSFFECLLSRVINTEID